MNASASGTKMDSIFISAVNPLAPSVRASFQSLTHINSLQFFFLKRAGKYFHSMRLHVNSTLMRLVHLQRVTVR